METVKPENNNVKVQNVKKNKEKNVRTNSVPNNGMVDKAKMKKCQVVISPLKVTKENIIPENSNDTQLPSSPRRSTRNRRPREILDL